MTLNCLLFVTSHFLFYIFMLQISFFSSRWVWSFLLNEWWSLNGVYLWMSPVLQGKHCSFFLWFPPASLLQTDQVERNYIKEKKAAVKEFDDKKVELKENLIAELEEKKKMIENEKLTMELTGGKGPRMGLLTIISHQERQDRGKIM